MRASPLDCNNGDSVQYEYDNNVLLDTTGYVYDSQNQLIRENNQAEGKTWTWAYDAAGNIQNRKEYAYTTDSLESKTPTKTVSYDYDKESGWGDLLTSYDGNTIEHDEIGNMKSDGTWDYEWEHGRELASMKGTVNGREVTWTYTYNADGMRTKRTNGSTTYEYVYNGTELDYMYIQTETTGFRVRFTHAPDGTPLGFVRGTTTYYYVTNLQGDVVALLDPDGNKVVEYTYDAWGNPLETKILCDESDENYNKYREVAEYNPLRYRGYVYDIETGLYYLQSRYYDPEMGRFISADNYLSTGRGVGGYNMFTYCNNNPIMLIDEHGEFPWLAVGIIAVCMIGGGIWGFSMDSKLGPQEPDLKLPATADPPRGQDNLGEEQTQESTAGLDVNAEEMSLDDRLGNMVIGIGLGMAVGGAVVSGVGAVGTVAVGSATTYIGAFGGTGAQTFSIGALAYNIFAMVVAPFFGVEMETIEIEP